jgi:ribosomal protein L40E
MQNLLPTLFIVLGACALTLTLFWLWMSLRHTLVHAEEAQVASIDPRASPRAALLAEKHSLLVALKDLEAERDTGKLSDADFTELSARYRARARSVLKQLDAQIAPHRDVAKAMLQSAGEAPKPESVLASSTPATSAAATQICESCSTTNDIDATFCKKCGARLQAEAKS